MKTDKAAQIAVHSNTIKACDLISQAIVCVQRAWIANPPSEEYADNVLNESEIHLSNILERLRTIAQ